MKNVLGIVKFAASTVVGIGASKIVGKIIKAHAVPETLLEKVTMVGGAWAIGGMVSKASKKYTDEVVDDVVKIATKVIDKSKESAKLGRIDRKESTFEKEGLDPAEYIQDPKTKVWVSLKTHRKNQLRKLNAGKINMVGSDLESHVHMGADGKWVLDEDDEQPDTITLRKNDQGVWEEISVRGKS